MYLLSGLQGICSAQLCSRQLVTGTNGLAGPSWLNLETSVESVARVPKAPNMGGFFEKFGESSSHRYGEPNFSKKPRRFKH